jgi:hypothetical protein
MESREGARGVEERTAQDTEQKVMNATTRHIDNARRHETTKPDHRLRVLVFSGVRVLIAGVLFVGAADAQTKTKAHVQTLASPRLEGRLAGSNGEKLASDYLAAELTKIGAKPLPGRTGFLLSFPFTAGTKDGGTRIAVGTTPFATEADVRALSFSDNVEVSGDVVFAGYGIVVPENQGFGYDSYATLDVKDKIVLVLRYFPEDADQKTRGILARYADLRYKAMAARQRGAKAIIVVTGPRSPNAGETVPMSFDTALAGSGIAAASVSGTVAKAMFTAGVPDKTLEAVQQSLDSANPHVAGFAMPSLTVTLKTEVRREQRTGHNVVGYLPATSPATAVAKPWIALGAHYDHLGRGEAGNTLAGKDDVNKVHFGADDNASGSAAVLAVAAELATQPRRRNVLVGFWSGEELGLLGSAAFAGTPPVAMDQIAAYLNFDMVGRMQDNKLTVQAAGSSPAWPKILEQANIAAGFDLNVQEDPYQPTDVATFNGASIASLSFFTGTHADYHKPSDTADKIQYEDLDRVVDFAASIARRVGDGEAPPAFAKVEQAVQTGGGRAGVRVFTGTIPDYASDVKGLLLGGVIGGGPAEQAGLQKGDVIVEIAGQTIANIYDYTYALDVLKIGQPAKVVYMRAGKRLETTLVAQRDEGGVAQAAVARPLGERHLGHQRRLHPAQCVHLLPGDALAPVALLRRRQVGEGTARHGETLHRRRERRPDVRREAGADFSGGDQLSFRAVVPDENRIEGRARRLVAADDQLLVLHETHLDPCIAPAADGVGGPRPFRDNALEPQGSDGRGNLRGGAGQRIREQHARSLDRAAQRGPAHVERLLDQVLAVDVQQIERVVDEREAAQIRMVQGLERRPPFPV